MLLAFQNRQKWKKHLMMRRPIIIALAVLALVGSVNCFGFGDNDGKSTVNPRIAW